MLCTRDKYNINYFKKTKPPKLGVRQIEEAASNLIKLSQKIDTEKMNKPSFLMVLTGGQVAYKRPDGVLVVPISCLKN